MKLSALKNRVQDAVVRVGPAPEDTVVVKYKPGALTYEMAEEIQRLALGANPDESVAFKMLMDLIESWDLQDEEGNDLPVTTEVIKQLPLDFVAQIMVVVRGEIIPGPLTDEISLAGSSPEDGSVVPLRTTQPTGQRGSLV